MSSSKNSYSLLVVKESVKFTVLTNNHGGVGARSKTTGNSSFGSITGRRVDQIEDNLKQVIKTRQSIRNELMPKMLDVDAISAVELFEAHLTGRSSNTGVPADPIWLCEKPFL